MVVGGQWGPAPAADGIRRVEKDQTNGRVSNAKTGRGFGSPAHRGTGWFPQKPGQGIPGWMIGHCYHYHYHYHEG